ncbi:MAG: AMIN domain-containing protein [Candidatus Sulfotelmatobacter sp.]
MHKMQRISASRLFSAALCMGLSALPSLAQVTVRQVRVLGSKDVVEVEVEASDRIVPQTQVLSNPDRLVVDFPNSRPTDKVRSQSVDRGEVKDVRVGLFQSKPPITRVVLDLKSARSYQIFPSGRTVMIKVVGGASSTAASVEEETAQHPQRAGLVTANYTTRAEPLHIEEVPSAAPKPPKVALEVSYRNGLLGIVANKATLSEVLYAIQQKTGADIPIPAGAEQEKVVAEAEPAPAPEVLARLLNGSRFNFLILSAPDDPNKLDRVILSTRAEGSFVPPPAAAQNSDDTEDDEPAVVRSQPQNVDSAPPPVQVPPRPEPDQNAPPANQETPDQ